MARDDTADVGRQLRASYAGRGVRVELERTVPLQPAEEVLLSGVMRLHGVGVLPRPALIRLTQHRLDVLAHYALQPDRIWDLPRKSVLSVELSQRGDAVVVSWASQRGPAVLALAAWTGRWRPAEPLRDTRAVAATLRAWQSPPRISP